MQPFVLFLFPSVPRFAPIPTADSVDQLLDKLRCTVLGADDVLRSFKNATD